MTEAQTVPQSVAIVEPLGDDEYAPVAKLWISECGDDPNAIFCTLTIGEIGGEAVTLENDHVTALIGFLDAYRELLEEDDPPAMIQALKPPIDLASARQRMQEPA